MFVVAIDACPSQACTVTGSTPRASHKHAAVCRRSWRRRPGRSRRPANGTLHRRGVQPMARPWSSKSRSSGTLALGTTSAPRGSTRFATGTRRLLPDFVTFASTPSGAARLTSSTGIGTRTKSRTRTSRSSHHRRPVHDRHQQDIRQWLVAGSDRHVEGLQLVFGERPDRGSHPSTFGNPRGGDRVARDQSLRTAQAKNADRDARNRRTDDSASPDWFSATSARVTSRSVTAGPDEREIIYDAWLAAIWVALT